MRLTVNSRTHTVSPGPGERLLTLLTDRLHLTGTKFGCGHGECGACTVILDGRLAYSCLVLAESCEGASITTIEGLAREGTLAPLQQAFIEHDAAQCGYCTPGQLIAASHLLERNPSPTEPQIREAMSGNLCRCGTYPKIITAIQSAARAQAAGTPATRGSSEARTSDAP